MSSVDNEIQQSTLSSEPQPARRKRIRRLLFGGFIITDEEALNWANRLRATQPDRHPITLRVKDEGRLLLTLDNRVKELGGIEVNFYGERKPGECYGSYIIVTQRGRGTFDYVNGESIMDPKKKMIPGPIEELAKELLEKEGVTHAEFDTVFG